MKVIKLKLGSIKPYENNPHYHPPEQVDALADFISKYGFLQPYGVRGG